MKIFERELYVTEVKRQERCGKKGKINTYNLFNNKQVSALVIS